MLPSKKISFEVTFSYTGITFGGVFFFLAFEQIAINRIPLKNPKSSAIVNIAAAAHIHGVLGQSPNVVSVPAVTTIEVDSEAVLKFNCPISCIKHTEF